MLSQTSPHDLFDRVQESITFLDQKGIHKVDVGIILGSGMSAVARVVNEEVRIPYVQIPHWAETTVEGHQGELIYGRIGEVRVLIFSGRVHYYEGHPMWKVAYAMRLLAAMAPACVITTGAAGGLNPAYTAGDLVVLYDHISLFPDNPLRGYHDKRFGERFPDMSKPYDKGLLHRLLQVAMNNQMSVHEGVYAGLPGPSLETKAEYEYLHRIGADLVGMSIIPEAIVAGQQGVPLLGLCCVSNQCYPTDQIREMTVEEILAVVDGSSGQIARLLTRFIERVRMR